MSRVRQADQKGQHLRSQAAAPGKAAEVQLGGGALGRAPPPAFHALAKDMSLNKGATHFTLGLNHVLLHASYYTYTRSPLSLKITQLRPCKEVDRSQGMVLGFPAQTISLRMLDSQFTLTRHK